MTYRRLASLINEMEPEQQDSDVTVLLQREDEIFRASELLRYADRKTEDRLDHGHPMIVVLT